MDPDDAAAAAAAAAVSSTRDATLTQLIRQSSTHTHLGYTAAAWFLSATAYKVA